jgi:hypothetical protein
MCAQTTKLVPPFGGKPSTHRRNERKRLAKHYRTSEPWTLVVEVSAVECSDIRFDLPPPPFPFVQRWHDQRYPNKTGKAKKKLLPETVHTEPEDLPIIPANITDLPVATSFNTGDVLFFKRLAMINWQPVISPWMTAKIEGVDGEFLSLRLAVRDRPVRRYDEETGERVYDKFEMPGADDIDDDGLLEMDSTELLEPRVSLA